MKTLEGLTKEQTEQRIDALILGNEGNYYTLGSAENEELTALVLKEIEFLNRYNLKLYRESDTLPF